MSQNLKHRVQMGLETTRGTAVTMTLEVGIVGDGFKPTITNGLGEIVANYTFPYKTTNIPVGLTAQLSLRVEVNRDNILDIIKLATKRTSGVLPSVTIVDDQHGVGVARYVGCVCSSLALEYSRGGTPGGESILTAVMTFECMSFGNGAGAINAGLSAANARRFQMRMGSTKVNNVTATDTLGSRITINNLLALGPVDSSNARLWIEDGLESQDISHTARFSATSWRTLIEAGTEVATNTIVIATGTANETVTASIATAQIGTRNLSESENVVVEEITVMPHGATPVSWAFGAAIGASVLGL